MNIKVTEDPLFCPACKIRITRLALQDRQCSSCGIPCYLATDDTKGSGEQMRMRQSRAAVLVEGGPREEGGSRW